jgi:L-threonylcarbamoyladenylate synthase
MVIQSAVTFVQNVDRPAVFAYPTESVYGLGCNPFDQEAVALLRAWKQRKVAQGFIIVAADFAQVAAWCQPVPREQWHLVQRSWPGSTTWVFQATAKAPQGVCAGDGSLAIRVSAHAVVRVLAQGLGPLVSTSANRCGQVPARTPAQVKQAFSQIHSCVSGDLGGLRAPSKIYSACTGRCLRA